jgi:teichuronic acid biosynthesis glycosyltransferase TuaC
MDIATNLFAGKVLFICSATRKGRCTEAISEQARGLKKRGVEVEFFCVEEPGIRGYFKGMFRLRRFLRQNYFDVVHAHYGLSSMMASMAGAKPLVVSLMGSDVFGPKWLLGMVKFFSGFVWPSVIVKSEQMLSRLGAGHAMVIPNGVDLSLFREIPQEEARKKVGFLDREIVLWPANPDREVKNVTLAREAVHLLNDERVELKIVFDVPTERMPWYYNAADVVLLTSKWEGSPNVVKEALACNVPVVSTPVGDVAKWLEGINGCEICQPDPGNMAIALKKTLKRKGRIDGREKIEELDIDRVSDRLTNEYVIAESKK